MTDIVREIISRAKQRIAEAYGLPPEVEQLLGEIEVEIKAEFKGDRVYVPAPRPHPDRVREDYRSGTEMDEIVTRHGISRATIYRYLKQR